MNAKTKILAAFAALILPLGAFAETIEFALEDVQETKTAQRKFCKSASIVLSQTDEAQAVKDAAKALLKLFPQKSPRKKTRRGRSNI